MGVRRRTGFVRSSDEEDEGSGSAIGVEGAGPSVTQKRRRRSISQAPHCTAGKKKEYKRLKHTMESKAIDLDSDSDEEDYEYEDIIGAASRQKKLGRKEDGGVMGKNGKSSFKLSPRKKRKQSISSAQNRYGSKAGGIQFEETVEESTQQQTADAVQPPLGKEFEQYLLEEVFNISKDTYTKELDLPERFQLHEQFVTAYVSKGDWSKEAYWIYDRAFGNSAVISQEEELEVIANIDKEEIVQEIIFVLMQLHVQKCEIPFIGMYNFHGCMHLAGRNGSSDRTCNFEENNMQLKSFKALWCIFHWDRKWLLLQHHIDKQQETWKKRAMVTESEFVPKDGKLDMLIQALQDAESELVVDDLVAKFNLQFPTDEVAPPKGQYKRPKRQSYYDMCCKSGLRQLVKRLGLTPEQLAENLQAMQKIHEALDCDVPPEDTDLSCASGQFTEVRCALAGARHMAAYELSCEPRVRNYIRSLFSEHAVLSTRPTAKGQSLIDTFHEYACVKYVQGKSVKKFDDGEWLVIQRAEEEQLVEVTIELTQEIFDGVVMQGLQEMYFSNGLNEVATLWNEQRKLTLQEAVSKMILPLLIKEMRMSLTAKAKAWVQSECGKNLWKRASVAPYFAADISPDDYPSSKAANEATHARVLACCWGSRNPPTTFVMLDGFGELIDTLQTGYLSLYSGSLDQQLQRKTDDQERLKNLIVKYQPHVVIVGATVHYACRQLKDTIAETVARAAELNTSLSSVPVIFGDESLPSLYEKSQVSNMQLPKQPSIIRRAVALGRSLQNPLALIASLCNPSKDIVALNLHPMQRFLSTEEMYIAIEQVMITVTNQVWVDVNLAVVHEWLFSPLQFICGLGWKKASMLQQLIQGIRWLPSREHLFRHPFSLKDVVFRNCSGFLRIRRVAHAVSGLRKLDPLDDTRIHPESYELARNLANYSLSKEHAFLDCEADMDMAETAVVHVQQNPNTLTEATVVDFFNSLQEMEQVNIETLKDIRAELLCGFRDYRAPYTQPTQDEEFSWLTGEDDTSLASGKPVNVTVIKVFRHRIMCVLESGIRGCLEKENFTSDSSVDLTKIFSEGSNLTCCIANVMKDQFLVNLTFKEAEGHAFSVPELLSSDKAVEKPGPKDYSFKPRDVCHSCFDNISVSDAIKALSDKNPGEVVFHPSSRGAACLSMTLKCHDNVYLRKEIEELDKDSTNLATFSKLGRILKIGGRSFQNLDEVVTSYASPLMGKMNEVLQLKEFQSGSDGEIKSFLHQEKGASSESLVYCFSMCPNNPGAIVVSYVVDGNIKQETVDLYPEGYGFQNKMFRKIDTLVNYLKKAVLAASNDPQMWGDRGEDGDGSERGRGRGGRFGSGRRGRGRDGRGGRGNSSMGKWGVDNKESLNSFGDAQEDAQEGGTSSAGWGGKDDWSQSQNDNGGNNQGRGERGSFRGRRGRGRGYGRGEGGQWGQANNKNGENFWSGGTCRKEDMDPLKGSDAGAGNNSWDAGNAGNDGWGSGNDGWGSTGCHMDEHSKKNDEDLSSWGAECNSKISSEEKWGDDNRGGRGGGNGAKGKWGDDNEDGLNSFGYAQEHAQEGGGAFSGGWGGKDDWSQSQNDNGGNSRGRGERGSFRGRRGRGRGYGRGGEGCQGGQASKKNEENFWSGGTVRKEDMDPLKASDAGAGNSSWDSGTARNDGWGSGNNGWGSRSDDWGSTGCHVDEHKKKNDENLSSWGAERSSEEKWGDDNKEGRGGGKDSRGKWGHDNEDGLNSFGDAKEVAQEEGGTFSGGWGGKDDWSQSQKNNGGNNWGRGERGGFRGRRGRGRGYGREGGQWGQANTKNEENFWSGGTGRKEDMDLLKGSDAGAGNNSRDAGNVGNDGWGSTGCDMDEHKKKNDDLSSWGAECNSSEGKWGVNNRDGRGGGNGSREKWGDDNEDGLNSFGDAQEHAQKGGDTFSGGWGGKDDWSQSQNNSGGNNRGRGERGSFRGRRGRGRAYGRGGEGCQWGQVNNKNEENSWSCGTGLKEDMDPRKASDAGAGNNSWDAGNVGNSGWGSGNDGWGFTSCHMDKPNKKNEKDPSSWNVECSSKSSSEGKGNGWVQDCDAEKPVQDDKSNGLEGWGIATEPLDRVSKDVEDTKDSLHGCDTVETADIQASVSCGNVASDGWGTENDGWGSTDCHVDELKKNDGWGSTDCRINEVKKDEKDLSGWGAECNSSEERGNEWAHDGNGNGGGLLCKGATVGGWGDDSQQKHRNVDMGWGGEKGQNNGSGGLLGKGPTEGGWGDDDSQEKDKSGGLHWGAQKEQHNDGWEGHGLEGKWSKDNNQQQTQNGMEGYNARGSFRGDRGWSRGMGRGGRGRWSQGEGRMGRGGRGRWAQGEDGMGRGNRGRWSQNEGDMGGGRGGWPQSQGDGASRRGRGGRGRWNGADSMERGGRGSWVQKQVEGANNNSWSSDGWNRESKAGKVSAMDANDWWASGGNQDTVRKERGLGNCSGPKNDSKDGAGTGWDGWATSGSEAETGGWGEQKKELESKRGLGNCLGPKDDSKDGAGTGWDGWAIRGSEVETGVWGEQKKELNSKRGLGNCLGPKDDGKDGAGTGWDGWATSGSEVETGGWGEQKKELNSIESTEQRRDGIWGACEDLIDSKEIEGLIDSKEMEGLISQKDPFDNALEPQNTNDTLQGQGAALRGLEDAAYNRSDNLAFSILEDPRKNKNIEAQETWERDHDNAS